MWKGCDKVMDILKQEINIEAVRANNFKQNILNILKETPDDAILVTKLKEYIKQEDANTFSITNQILLQNCIKISKKLDDVIFAVINSNVDKNFESLTELHKGIFNVSIEMENLLDKFTGEIK